MIKYILHALLCCCGAAHYLQAQPAAIVPHPLQVEAREGTFTITPTTGLQYVAKDADMARVAHFFNRQLQAIAGFALPMQAKGSQLISLQLTKDSTLGKEGYQLDISPKGIQIAAYNATGLRYGIQSLLQLLPPVRTNAALQVPCMQLRDYPNFAWRGLHLDVSRHFFGPEVIKNILDLMYTYKLNTFHWHLVDDTGWRLEIKKYPKLTGVGAWRVDENHLPWSERPQASPGKKPTYGGYYTQQQIRELVQYASERNITIVPEIEMPGHVASAIAAYPHLSCKQQLQLPMTGGNYKNIASNYCAGNDSVFTFLQDVLAEVMALFPGTYVHIGGDEVDKSSWLQCAKCQHRMHNHGLKDGEALQSYFIKRIEKFLSSKDKKIIGWDEILEGGLAPGAAVMSWRGEAGGIEAANMQHKVVMTPGKPLYFDHYQAGPYGEPEAIGGMNTLKNVYDYYPVPTALPASKKEYIMGAQANVWTEYIPTAQHLYYMLLPRMLALSEMLWLPPAYKNWERFYSHVEWHKKRLAMQGYSYSQGSYQVQITPTLHNGQLLASLTNEVPGSYMVYTTDGSHPNLESTRYTAPIPITHSLQLQAAVVEYGKIKSLQPAAQSFAMHKATGANVQWTQAPATAYAANGPQSLTDGIRGTHALGRAWQGFSGTDMEATIDLQEPTTVRKLSLGFLQHYKDWIFLPDSVQYYGSADGKNFTRLGTVHNLIVRDAPQCMQDFQLVVPGMPAYRYLKAIAKKVNCPKGHPGEGKPGWLFVDEWIVE